MSLKPGSLSTDATQLGRRDAFHAPSVLVQADEPHWPGESVRLLPGHKAERATGADRHGVIDPFLPSALIPPGRLFWVMLLPDLVDDLTHSFGIKGIAEKAANAAAAFAEPEDDFDRADRIRCASEGCT